VCWEKLWDIKRDTIEHILPQTPKASWKNAFPDSALRKRWTHDIGNLTLTYDNSWLFNKSFIEKLGQPAEPHCYSGSSFFIERQLASYTQWTEIKLVERREQIKSWALARWAMDEADVAAAEEADEPLERIRKLAEDSGVESEYEAICEFAKGHQLFIRPYKRAIVLSPADNHSIALCTIWPESGHLKTGVWFINFEKCFKVPKQKLHAIFETADDQFYVVLTSSNLEDFLIKFNRIWQ
jgi:hypothetical protein